MITGLRTGVFVETVLFVWQMKLVSTYQIKKNYMKYTQKVIDNTHILLI